MEALDCARRDHPFDLWAFVVMPEHVHLIIRPRGPRLRSRSALAAIKLPVSRRILAFVTKNAPHFLSRMLDKQPNGEAAHRFWQRGGGYDRDLHEPGTIHATIDYIHVSPVRAGRVERPELWRWSSAAYFAGTGAAPLKPDVDSIPKPPGHWRFWSCG